MHRNAVTEMPCVLENTGSFIFCIENTVYARFTQDLLQLIFKIIYINIKSTAIFDFLLKNFWKPIKFTMQSHLTAEFIFILK